jgi:hypothetical protein
LHCETVIFRLERQLKFSLPSEQHYLKWVVEFLHVQFVMVFYRNQVVIVGGFCVATLSKGVKVTMLVRSEI